MNITRDIVKDLLPAYFAGEATADTRRAVEEYFKQDPIFEREAHGASRALTSVGMTGTTPPDSAAEKTALQRAKRVLRTQRLLLAFASTFTLNAFTLGFSIEIGTGRARIHWLAVPGQRELVIAILLISVLLWTLYARISRQVHKQILG